MGARSLGRLVAATVGALSVVALAGTAGATDPSSGRSFAPVFEGVVEGDLLLAANSNLGSADVDGDATTICAFRAGPARAEPGLRRQLQFGRTGPPGGRPGDRRPPVRRDHAARVVPPGARVPRRPGDGLRLRGAGGRLAVDRAHRHRARRAEAVRGDRRRRARVPSCARPCGTPPPSSPRPAGARTRSPTSSASASPRRSRHASWALAVTYERDPAVVLEGLAEGDRRGSRLVSFRGTTASSTSPPAPSTSRSAACPTAHGSPRASTSSPAATASAATTCCSTGDRSATAPRPVTWPRRRASSSAAIRFATASPTSRTGPSAVLGTATATGAGVDVDVVRIPGASLRAAGSEADRARPADRW